MFKTGSEHEKSHLGQWQEDRRCRSGTGHVRHLRESGGRYARPGRHGHQHAPRLSVHLQQHGVQGLPRLPVAGCLRLALYQPQHGRQRGRRQRVRLLCERAWWLQHVQRPVQPLQLGVSWRLTVNDVACRLHV